MEPLPQTHTDQCFYLCEDITLRCETSRVSSLLETPSPTLTLVFDLSPLQNMPNVRDHDASVYLRLQGDALSVGGYEQNPIFWDEVRMVPFCRAQWHRGG